MLYKGESEFAFEGGKFHDRANWQIWVVRANPDGSWHLIIRHANAVSTGDASARQETVSFTWCDLFPDGRLVESDTLDYRVQLRELRLRLPTNAEEAAKGWTARDAVMDETYQYRLLPGVDQDQCRVGANRESPLNEIYGFVFNDVINFDTKRGLPTKIEMENKQTYGFKGTGRGTLKLEEIKTHDAAWCKAFAADAERFFAAQAAFRKVSSKRDAAPEEFKAAL